MAKEDLLNNIKTIGAFSRMSDADPSEPMLWAGAQPTPGTFTQTVGMSQIFDQARQEYESERRLKIFGRVAPRPFQIIASPFFELWNGLQDVFYGRRRKTTIVLNACIFAGIAVGVSVALVLIPALITALGPAGVFLAGTSIAFGGSLGFAVFGAMLGGLVGKKVTQKLFSTERKMQPKKVDSARYHRIYHVEEDIYILMNAYLQNRAARIDDPIKKRMLNNLRKNALKKSQASQHVCLGHYFCEELDALFKMKKSERSLGNIDENIRAVQMILKSLSLDATLMDEVTKEKIKETLAHHETPDYSEVDSGLQERLASHIKRSSNIPTVEHQTDTRAVFNRSFQNATTSMNKQLNILATNIGFQLDASENKHTFTSRSGIQLPPVKVYESIEKDLSRTDYLVSNQKFIQLSLEQKKELAICLVIEFEAHPQTDKALEILANGDAEFATLVYIEAKRHGVDNITIAEDGFASKKQIQEIIEQAEEKFASSQRSRLSGV